MRSRVERLAPGSSVWIGTFHRFCARLLRKYAPLVGLQENYTIYDTGDSAQTLRRAMGAIARSTTAYVTPEADRPGHQLGQEQSHHRPTSISRSSGHRRWEASSQQVYPAYQAKLAASNAVDFDDLLLHVATLLAREPRSPRRPSTSATATSSSTNTRTPTWPSTPSPGPCRSTIPTWR